MAKGLRSKSKRKNRTILRETFYTPKLKVNQEAIAQKITEGLKHRKGESIVGLKGLLSTTPTPAPEAAKMTAEDDEEDEATKTASKKTTVTVVTKRKGSKPRLNPGKELVWFK